MRRHLAAPVPTPMGGWPPVPSRAIPSPPSGFPAGPDPHREPSTAVPESNAGRYRAARPLLCLWAPWAYNSLFPPPGGALVGGIHASGRLVGAGGSRGRRLCGPRAQLQKGRTQPGPGHLRALLGGDGAGRPETEGRLPPPGGGRNLRHALRGNGGPAPRGGDVHRPALPRRPHGPGRSHLRRGPGPGEGGIGRAVPAPGRGELPLQGRLGHPVRGPGGHRRPHARHPGDPVRGGDLRRPGRIRREGARGLGRGLRPHGPRAPLLLPEGHLGCPGLHPGAGRPPHRRSEARRRHRPGRDRARRHHPRGPVPQGGGRGPAPGRGRAGRGHPGLRDTPRGLPGRGQYQAGPGRHRLRPGARQGQPWSCASTSTGCGWRRRSSPPR